MTSRTKIFLSSTQILVSVLFITSFITVLQQGTFLSRVYLGGQLASVNSVIPADCILPLELDENKIEFTGIRSKLDDIETSLLGVESLIQKLQEKMQESSRQRELVDQDTYTREQLSELDTIDAQNLDEMILLTSKKASLKAGGATLLQNFTEVVKQKSDSNQNMCPTVENYCSDGIDNDRDNSQDCNDSDCVDQFECVGVKTDHTVNPIVDGDTNNAVNSLVTFTSASVSATTPAPMSTTTAPSTNTVPLIVVEKDVATESNPTLITSNSTPKSPVSDVYNTIIEAISSNTNKALNNNNTKIVPLMQSLRLKSSTSDLSGLFNAMDEVRAEINANQSLVTIIRSKLLNLQTENNSTTIDTAVKSETGRLLVAGNSLTSAMSSYHTTLLKFLTDSVPSSTLEDELTTQIKNLALRTSDFNRSINTLKEEIISAVERSETPLTVVAPLSEFAATSFSPGMNEKNVSVVTNQIRVTFSQNILSYKEGLLLLRSDDGDVVTSSQMSMLDNRTFVADLAGDLKKDKKYTISFNMKFVMDDGAQTMKEWKQVWSFETEASVTLTSQVVDFFRDFFGGDDK